MVVYEMAYTFVLNGTEVIRNSLLSLVIKSCLIDDFATGNLMKWKCELITQ